MTEQEAETLTSTLISSAYAPVYSEPSWRKAPYGPTEPATRGHLPPEDTDHRLVSDEDALLTGRWLLTCQMLLGHKAVHRLSGQVDA